MQHAGLIFVVVHLLVEVAVLIRVMLRPNRVPVSRLAWVAVIVAVPVLGIAAYLLVGETRIGRRRVARMQEISRKLVDANRQGEEMLGVDSAHGHTSRSSWSAVPSQFEHLFRLGESISHFPPVAGNTAELMADSNAAISRLVADIDAASRHVHLLFYIWLPDNNGQRVAEAVIRAARRGVTCRVMVDYLGSRLLMRSPLWRQMRESGAQVASALPIGLYLMRILSGRIDLRNHRKIAVIDGQITYCGSQNCADPEFRVKARYAPWVDAMVRFVGPIARQNQQLFAGDWMAYVDEDLCGLMTESLSPRRADGVVAQAIGTGPTVRYSAMPELFESLIHAARREVVITTPYYVPDESMQNAICTCAYRGVDTTIIFPARNDSFVVGAASRSYYRGLLDAGVKIYEYQLGLLHTKSLVVDSQVVLIGSANMDRRSFDLNYENNILSCDAELATAVRGRQQAYLHDSRPVAIEEVAAWSLTRRLWNNTLAVLGPIL